MIAALRIAWMVSAIGPLIASTMGCTGSRPSPEYSGEEARRRLPSDLARVLPTDFIECHHESSQSPALYQLWIVRRPGGSWLTFPEKLSGLERHDLPAEILVGMLNAKVPSLELGSLQSKTCRFTHWNSGDATYQVREILTDRGWFASVEEFRKSTTAQTAK